MADKVRVSQSNSTEEHVHEAPASTDHTARRGFLTKILMASSAMVAALVTGRGNAEAQSRRWGRWPGKRSIPWADEVHPQYTPREARPSSKAPEILDRPEIFRSPPGTIRFKGRDEIILERTDKGFRTVLQHSHHVRR